MLYHVFGTLLTFASVGLAARHKCAGSFYNDRDMSGSSDYEAQKRHYCVGIVEEKWNYAPNSTGSQYDLTGAYEATAEYYLSQTDTTIGSSYFKVFYRGFQYDDHSKACDWDAELAVPTYMGVQGPVIRGVIGDTLEVHVKNFASETYSFNVQGLIVELDDEDIFSIGPNVEAVAEYYVPSRAGPLAPFSSNAFTYSSVDTVSDMNSGLLGLVVVVDPVYIVSSEQARLAWPCDIHTEMYMNLIVFDENESRYLDDNIAQIAAGLSNDDIDDLMGDSDFVTTNIKHTINGYMFGNFQVTVPEEENTRWYVSYWSSKNALGVVNWDGNVVLHDRYSNSLVIPSSGALVADMRPAEDGVWSIGGAVSEQQLGSVGRMEVVEMDEDSGKNTKSDNSSDGYTRGMRAFAITVVVISVLVTVALGIKSMYAAKKRAQGDSVPIYLDESSAGFSEHNPKGSSESDEKPRRVEL